MSDQRPGGSAKYPWERQERVVSEADEPYEPLWAKRPWLIAAAGLVALVIVVVTLVVLRGSNPTPPAATETACGLTADQLARYEISADLRPEVVTNEPGRLAICRFTGKNGKVEINLSADRVFACGGLGNERPVAVTVIVDDACVVDVDGPPARTVVEARRGSTIAQVIVEGLGSTNNEREALATIAMNLMLYRVPAGFPRTGSVATLPPAGSRVATTTTAALR